ncbi:MAG: hypothetical protein CR982_05460 [Candidatus Cloacimonadota bacterium]|nr:MAG: hypothetical protein CR982_05460 [Candidatus Cloacimonadota bacterium]PIE77585.1 MAG: hypothetical protein CSA15_12165 [Candidatus Delongbacteria bacterium]
MEGIRENSINLPNIVEDEYLYEHRLSKKLGEGGQGLVCATENPLIVVKFVTDRNGNLISKTKNKELFDKYNTRFNNIRLLPVDRNIAKPIALLNDYAGYIMQFMEDMMPLSVLEILDTNEKAPAWLVGKNPSTEKLSTAQQRLFAYCKNGGLRHRLEILGKTAKVLSQLHTQGLVYCDISPNNIFITNDIDFENPNVWFIDADNISFSSEDITKGNTVFTPRYVAPEVYTQKTVCTQDSDIYAFALTAFEKISLVYPFSGEMTNSDDDWDDWDESTSINNAEDDFMDPMEKAYRGELDWIWQKESNNKSSDGLPKGLVLTPSLYQLFNLCFSKGRQQIEFRPPMILWHKTLLEAKDLTIKCSNCKMSWYFPQQKSICPYCDNKVKKVLLIKEIDRNKEENLIFAHEIEANQNILISKQRLGFPKFDKTENSLLQIKYQNSEKGTEIDSFLLNLRLDEKEKCKISQNREEQSITHQIEILANDFLLEIELNNKKRKFKFEVIKEN